MDIHQAMQPFLFLSYFKPFPPKASAGETCSQLEKTQSAGKSVFKCFWWLLILLCCISNQGEGTKTLSDHPYSSVAGSGTEGNPSTATKSEKYPVLKKPRLGAKYIMLICTYYQGSYRVLEPWKTP